MVNQPFSNGREDLDKQIQIKQSRIRNTKEVQCKTENLKIRRKSKQQNYKTLNEHSTYKIKSST